MYSIQQEFIEHLKVLFKEYTHLLTPHFEKEIECSIRVLHHQYLFGACKEAKVLLDKNQGKIYKSLFDIIMDIYSKRRSRHQAYFFILQCFENALRSTMATVLANAFNHGQDDWFLYQNPDYSYLVSKAQARSEKLNKPINKGKCTTFDVFDLFSLGDLEHILRHYYPYFEQIFKAEKTYKGRSLPVFRTKQHALNTIKRIRSACNEIFHNKPTRIKFQEDVEVLLLRLDYNLEKAIKATNWQDFLHLKF
ncbi:hypothetical protein [Helicobacter salomonis]|uniref:hypothetical protein n=1 Tax=Helicobacter salomonis TaxID=56878 RepID=UPI000CF1668D|nr:hypothetical protein [Helicobacter salomonis]